MALMDKPTGPAPEDQTELSDVVALEEDNDVEQENIQTILVLHPSSKASSDAQKTKD